MKKNLSNFKFYAIIWAIFFALYNLIVFIVPTGPVYEAKNASFWVGYALIILAFIGQLVCGMYTFRADSLTKVFYRIPLIGVCFGSLVILFVVGSICMLIPVIPVWLCVIVCFAAVAYNAIGIVKGLAAIDAVESVDKKVKTKTLFIKSLTLEAETVMAGAKTDELKAEAKQVYEAIRYSDPMSDEALSGVEAQIETRFSEFSAAVAGSDLTAAQHIAAELKVLIGSRNSKCKLLK